jgi:hypothetical protein
MFWVRWRKLQKINWLLWRRSLRLNADEKAFLRNIREVLRANRRKLTEKQDKWLNDLYDRGRSPRRR